MQVAYFAQHQLDELNPNQSAYDHVRERLPDETEARIRARTGALGFPMSKMNTPARDLSGGEKARLLLGLATFGGAHLLILDEPTNHLDIDSREALVRALADYQGAVILISHDRHLVEASVDRLWLVADGTVRTYDGDLDDYRRLVLDARAGGGAAKGGQAANPAQSRRRSAAERREQIAPLRKKIRQTESLIEKLHKEIQAFDARLADPSLYARDPARIAAEGKGRAEAVGRLPPPRRSGSPSPTNTRRRAPRRAKEYRASGGRRSRIPCPCRCANEASFRRSPRRNCRSRR